jgi:uncharacterized spore protein YtfJ
VDLGAGVNIAPVGFLIVGTNSNEGNFNPRFIPVEHKCSIDKLLDYIPDLFDKVNESISKAKTVINDEKIKEEIKKIKPEKQKNKKEKKDEDETYEFEYDETKDQEQEDD